MICVHVRPEMTQIALLEGRTLVEHYISRVSDDATQIDGNIYRGRVQNVLPGMEAAFIDIGTPKNAVLYHGDVRYDTDDVESHGGRAGSLASSSSCARASRSSARLRRTPSGPRGRGSPRRCRCRVGSSSSFPTAPPTASPSGSTTPSADACAASWTPSGRRAMASSCARPPPERALRSSKPTSSGSSAQWEEIATRSTEGQGPQLLYREPAIAVRVIREELNREYRAVVIDDLDLYEQVRDYVEAVNPELADRVEYFDTAAEDLPVFERYHVHEQLHKALDRKVWLPSGGSLVIDRTEALTVIDVNTGKNVGTTNLEETVYRNNLEAAEEVARQLRLRDIGGIIVIDFIDMEVRENRDKVGAALRSALARDKTRTQVFDISELGLVEMTRKRVSEGLIESMSTTCTVCGGRGIVFEDPEE